MLLLLMATGKLQSPMVGWGNKKPAVAGFQGKKRLLTRILLSAARRKTQQAETGQ